MSLSIKYFLKIFYMRVLEEGTQDWKDIKGTDFSKHIHAHTAQHSH